MSVRVRWSRSANILHPLKTPQCIFLSLSWLVFLWGGPLRIPDDPTQFGCIGHVWILKFDSYHAVARVIAISIWQWARTALLEIFDLLIALSRSRRLNCQGCSSTGSEEAVKSGKRSAPEHYPCMTSEHSTTARWIRLGIDFEKGGNQSAQRKPLKSAWHWLKLNPHTTFVVEVEGTVMFRLRSR